jgi:hypothetical protein
MAAYSLLYGTLKGADRRTTGEAYALDEDQAARPDLVSSTAIRHICRLQKHQASAHERANIRWTAVARPIRRDSPSPRATYAAIGTAAPPARGVL